MIKKQSIEKFQKALGSKKSTPGGGIMSAMNASFAASLVEMVCNLTLNTKGYEKVQKDILRIHKNAIDFKKRLDQLAEEDKKAYKKIAEAYKLKSKVKIKKSLKLAIEIPMKVRRLSQDVEKIAFKVSKIGNKSTVGDAKTAMYMAHASSKAALENAKVHKDALKKI